MTALHLARLEALILENSATIALVKTEMDTAGHFFTALAAHAERFPGLKSQLQSRLHLLAGRVLRLFHTDFIIG